jgi:hypothetical protein
MTTRRDGRPDARWRLVSPVTGRASPRNRRTDATDLKGLAFGAECISANIGRERRVTMNRIRKASGLTLTEQLQEALDMWFEQRKGET